ncbi:MAG TPA: T9SS type A sorting domain-containing protein [Chitinophagaceae bacterium]|nr:T9SS type A sorting domain-containing protein [Chitinophagaceae bacterium]
MKKIFTIIFLGIACLQAGAQMYIQPGAQLSGGNNSFTFYNTSLVNNDPATDLSNAFLVFIGNVNSMLQGSGNWTLRNLTVHKETGLLQLGANIQITHILQMQSGKLDLNGQIVTLAGGALLQSENEFSRVIGPNGGIIQTTVNLSAPVTQNPGNLGAFITSNQNLGMVTIKRWHNVQNGDTKAQRFYEITPEKNTGLNATLRLHYFDAELNANPEAGLALYTRSGNAQPWTGTAFNSKDLALNYIEKTGVGSLHQYSFATASGALPLKWGPLSATCRNDVAEIKWTTLEEQNVKHFIVQKNDAGQWKDLATVNAKGNSNAQQTYSYRDAAPGSNIGYRVVSVDVDARQSYSIVMPLSGCAQKLSLTVSPVPSYRDVKLTINSPQAFMAEIKLAGSDGKVHQQRTAQIAVGVSQHTINMQSLPAGVYYVLVQTPEGLQKLSVIKQ